MVCSWTTRDAFPVSVPRVWATMTVLRRLVRVDERAERLELAAAVQVDKDRVEAGEFGEVSGSPRVHRVPLERREPPARLVDERRGEVQPTARAAVCESRLVVTPFPQPTSSTVSVSRTQCAIALRYSPQFSATTIFAHRAMSRMLRLCRALA